MIAQIRAQHSPARFEGPGQCSQVCAGAKQTVQGNNRRTIAVGYAMKMYRCFHKIAGLVDFSIEEAVARIAGFAVTADRESTTVRFVVAILCLFVVPFATAFDKDTLFKYSIDRAELAKHPLHTVMIAPYNLGVPSRIYLRSHEAEVDKQVTKYLEKHGYKVLDNDDYKMFWKQATAHLGDPYDPSTGRMNVPREQQAIAYVFQQLHKSHPDLDAVIFTDLIDRQVYFTGGLRREARWDGVSRPPAVQGPGDGVPTDFDWAQPVDAASLAVYVFNIEGRRVFFSVGGLGLGEAIDLHGTPRFKRYRYALQSRRQIDEGIELAFHPLIPMKDYPGDD